MNYEKNIKILNDLEKTLGNGQLVNINHEVKKRKNGLLSETKREEKRKISQMKN